MPVLLNDFQQQWTALGPKVLSAVDRVGASGWYVLGEQVRHFEGRLASFCQVSHAVGLASGLDALEIALRAVGMRPGDKVLTTPLSAFATTLAIVRAGGVPVFVDVDERGSISLDAMEECLSLRPDIRFAVPVHLYGFPIDIERLLAIKEKYDLIVVEDCAQAIGASWNGMAVGARSDAAALSFYPTKNLGALGDGGALFCSNVDIAAQARKLRDYGQSAKYIHDDLGLNSRLDELQAAILGVFLDELGAWTTRRRSIASRYAQAIQSTALVVPKIPSKCESVFHLYPVLLREPERRQAFLEHMKSRDIQTAVHYPRLIPEQKALEQAPFETIGDLRQAKAFAAAQVSLPIHPYLSDEEVEKVSAACRAF